MNYYRIVLFCALNVLLYNAYHLLPDGVSDEMRWRVFDTCKSAIIVSSSLLLWCRPSLIAAAMLCVHYAFLFLELINTAINGDVGQSNVELYAYCSVMAVLFIIRNWFGDSQLKYYRQWRINTRRKLKKLFAPGTWEG